MRLLVDTSVWSLAFRRTEPIAPEPTVARLRESLLADGDVLTTGLVLQELLQGFAGPAQRDALLARFAALPLLVPERRDHVEAAELRNRCRRAGVQAGTVDALIAQLALRHELTLLSTDRDFEHMSRIVPLPLWRA